MAHFWDRSKARQVISALERFTQQFYWAETLTYEQSVAEIEDSLLELSYFNGEHCGNGILVTEDGYFLTANHCVKQDLFRLRVNSKHGKYRIIEKVCAVCEKHDIALAKANFFGECKEKSYKMFNTNEPKFPRCMGLTCWNGNIKRTYGNTVRDCPNVYIRPQNGEGSINLEHHLEIEIPVIEGDSGGVLVSPDGRLMGILSIGRDISPISLKDSKFPISSCVKIIKAMELVHFYKRTIEKEIL